MSVPSNISKAYFDFIKAIGDAKTKQDEDKIMNNEIAILKKTIFNPKSDNKTIHENMLRMLYAEMLGHDCSFGYIKVIELSANNNVYLKKVGYLVAASCIGPEHEFRMMVVNMLQKDMTSSDHIQVANALISIAKLVTVELIPAVINHVVPLLTHKREFVRKKAILALHRFWQLDHDSISHLYPEITKMICDSDPAVMSASVVLIDDLAKQDPSIAKGLVNSVVSILKQVIENKLARDYDYHRMPAPWLQIKLIRLLSRLGYGDQDASGKMYSVIAETLQRSETGLNAGFAVAFECIRAIFRIYPNNTLMETANANITKFIQSPQANLKYIGLSALEEVVKENQQAAASHQMAVMDCLQSDDQSLRRKALDLLFCISNINNVQVVIDRMLDFLKNSTDEYFQEILVKRINDLAERFYNGDTSWYIRTITSLFLAAGDKVPESVANTVMKLLDEGQGDPEADAQLRSEAVAMYLELLDEPKLPDVFVQVVAYILGEYGATAAEGLPSVIASLCTLFHKESNPEIQGYCLTAVTKLTAQLGQYTPEAESLLAETLRAKNVDLQTRAILWKNLMDNQILIPVALPPKDYQNDIYEIDESLPFTQDYVNMAIANGAKEYEPPEEMAEEYAEEETSFKVDAYETPEQAKPAATNVTDLPATAPAGKPSAQALFGASVNGVTLPPSGKETASGSALFTENKAADLFSGPSSTGFFGPAKGSTFFKPAEPEPEPEPAAPAEPAAEPAPAAAPAEEDIFGFNASTPTADTHIENPYASNNSPTPDIFGFDYSVPAPVTPNLGTPTTPRSPVAAPAPAPAPAPANDPFSFGGFNTTPAAAPAAPANDPFSFGGFNTTPAAPAAPAAPANDPFSFGGFNTTPAAPAAAPANDPFSFGGFNSTPAAAPTTNMYGGFGASAPAAAPANDPFSFGGFNTTQPQQQPQQFMYSNQNTNNSLNNDPFKGLGF